MVHSDFRPATRPALPDIKSCEQWLGRAPLADSREACRAFLELFDEIEDAPPPLTTYAAILERLRAPLRDALDEHMRRFAGKPVPLGHVEAAAFRQSCDVWLALLRAWRRLLRSAINQPLAIGSKPRALCARRSLEACAGLLDAHFAAHRVAEADLWLWLHEGYAAAAPFDPDPASDAVSSGDTAIASYASALLIAIARPEALSAREYAFVRHCASRFGGKLAIRREIPASTGSGYAIDDECDGPPQWLPAEAGGLRLDMRAIARSLKWRLRQLAAGIEPSRLGLPPESGIDFATAMLNRLVRAWTHDAPGQRRFPRRAGNTDAECAVGLANIHRVMTVDTDGALPDDAPRSWNYSRGAAEQIHVFQRSLEAAIRTPPSVIERWKMLDESASGFRLRREGPGSRLALNQLVALRPHGARRFILANLRWAQAQSEAAVVVAGLLALPGLAQPCLVRSAAEEPALSDPWSAAFLLPVATGFPACLVLPAGRWDTGRMLELRLDGESCKVMISELIEHGHDYDRARFIDV